MAIFGKNDGGVMDVIRCDEPDYLIWKWHPTESDPKQSQRQNAIRWGSSLRVSEGSVAVFVYPQADGTVEDFIEGPYDQIIETENFPVLASLIGTLYSGGSPFQAEVYFINLANMIQIKFGVPYFDVFDPRFDDYGVPVAVRGSISFHIADYREFIKLHRLQQFNVSDFQNQIRDVIIGRVKNVVTNAPSNTGIPLIQIERHISEINALVEKDLIETIGKDFGVAITRVDISDIEINKNSDGYKKYEKLTQNKANDFVQSATTIFDTIGMHKSGAKKIKQVKEEAMGNTSAVNDAGQKVSSAFNSVIGSIKKNSKPTPPPIPTTGFYVVEGDTHKGPFDISKLKSMKEEGSFDQDTLVWKEGMDNWLRAGEVEALSSLFSSVTPPPIPGN